MNFQFQDAPYRQPASGAPGFGADLRQRQRRGADVVFGRAKAHRQARDAECWGERNFSAQNLLKTIFYNIKLKTSV